MSISERRTTDTKSSIPVLDAELAPGVYPGDRTIDTGDHAGSALQTASKFDLHLATLFVQFIEMGGTGVDAESLPAGLAFPLVEGEVALRIVLEGVNGQFFFNLHSCSSAIL